MSNNGRRSLGSYFTLTVAAAAIIISVVALFVGGVFNDNNGPNVRGDDARLPAYLSLYRSTEQAQQAPLPGWTNTAFDKHIIETTAWYRGEGDDTVVCNATGEYLVYFAIQAQVTPATATTTTATDLNSLESVLPPCKPCNLRYSIRATRHIKNQTTGEMTDLVLEIPGSLTYSSGYAFHLSKQFYIFGNVGDVFRFQFASHCPTLSLHPSPYVVSGEVPTDSEETHPASANLLIM